MKRCLAALLCILLLLLTGCGGASVDTDAVIVSLMPTEGCYIPANGQRIESGADAVFELVLEEGYAFASVDYDGEYEFYIEGGKEYLRLHDVRYPARVRLRLTDRFRTVCYHPNGGQGSSRERTYDVSYHLRPNTSIGTQEFSRPGYTLTGWNTQADGSGGSIGLGSRVSVPSGETLDLYAQWEKWTDEQYFTCTGDQTLTVTGYTGDAETIVIPESIGGKAVTAIASGAFQNCGAQTVILPKSMETVETDAFINCALRELVVFDNIEQIGSDSFRDCPNLMTLRINAQEPPYAYGYRKEVCLADKVDLLIEARGQQKIVFYGGCSMWYNLDGGYIQQALGSEYRVINAGVNGVMNSAVQLQILTACLEEGDILFHTPELSSQTQLMTVMELGSQDDKLWCAIEYNYDMLTMVDIREFPDLLDSFCQWLNHKQLTGTYDGRYVDDRGREYMDALGGIPFVRQKQEGILSDDVFLDPTYIQEASMRRLETYYDAIAAKGVTVYVSYACVNMDAVPPQQRENLRLMDQRFRGCIDAMESATLISNLEDYCFGNGDFFDTNYHLLSETAGRNTETWLRDLRVQMEADGLWPEA